jgi:hypothetical protein
MYAPYEQHQSINLDNNINYDWIFSKFFTCYVQK